MLIGFSVLFRFCSGLPGRIFSFRRPVSVALTHWFYLISIGFNCNIKFPGLFSNLLAYFTIANLDMVPSLGLACSFEGFDYADQVSFFAVCP